MGNDKNDSYNKSWWGSPNLTWGSIYRKYLIETDEAKEKKNKENKGK